MNLGVGPYGDEVPVELIGRVMADGGQFVATVDGLELEAMGSNRLAAENALVQVVRGWLERQDTAGRLADALGIADLDEATEIVLQFINSSEDDAGDALPR